MQMLPVHVAAQRGSDQKYHRRPVELHAGYALQCYFSSAGADIVAQPDTLALVGVGDDGRLLC